MKDVATWCFSNFVSVTKKTSVEDEAVALKVRMGPTVGRIVRFGQRQSLDHGRRGGGRRVVDIALDLGARAALAKAGAAPVTIKSGKAAHVSLNTFNLMKFI